MSCVCSEMWLSYRAVAWPVQDNPLEPLARCAGLTQLRLEIFFDVNEAAWHFLSECLTALEYLHLTGMRASTVASAVSGCIVVAIRQGVCRV